MVLYDTEVGIVASEVTRPARTSRMSSSFCPEGACHDGLPSADSGAATGGTSIAERAAVESAGAIVLLTVKY